MNPGVHEVEFPKPKPETNLLAHSQSSVSAGEIQPSKLNYLPDLSWRVVGLPEASHYYIVWVLSPFLEQNMSP